MLSNVLHQFLHTSLISLSVFLLSFIIDSPAIASSPCLWPPSRLSVMSPLLSWHCSAFIHPQACSDDITNSSYKSASKIAEAQWCCLTLLAHSLFLSFSLSFFALVLPLSTKHGRRFCWHMELKGEQEFRWLHESPRWVRRGWRLWMYAVCIALLLNVGCAFLMQVSTCNLGVCASDSFRVGSVIWGAFILQVHVCAAMCVHGCV